MNHLRVLYKNERYSEGAEIDFDGRRLRIQHITSSGFLYIKPCSDYLDTVTVTSGESNTSETYYKDWDSLMFVGCEVEFFEM